MRIEGTVSSLVYSSDGKYLAVTTTRARKPWGGFLIETAARKVVAERPGLLPGFAFAPDGNWLVGAAACSPTILASFDIPKLLPGNPGPEQTPGAAGAWQCVAFHPSAKSVLAATRDGRVFSWEVTGSGVAYTPERSWDLGGKDTVIKLLTYIDNRTALAARGTGETELFLLGKKAEFVSRFRSGIYRLKHAALSPDRKTLATVGEDDPTLWDWRTGKALVRIKGVTGRTTGLAFTPDGKHLVTGGDDCGAKTPEESVQLKVWATDTGKLSAQARDPGAELPDVLALAMAPNGKTLATGGDDCVDFWDLAGLLKT
jgi:WD40 repeat protein